MKTILITVEGGVVQSVGGIPPGVQVEIRDFDVDGCAPEEYDTTIGAFRSFYKGAPPKKKAAREQVIEMRDGKPWYGRLCNFTTGPRMTFCTFPDDGKPRKISKWLKSIIDARAAGLIKPGRDWFPEYMRQLEKAKALDARINAPRPQWTESETEESHKAKLEAWTVDVDMAQIAMKRLKRKVYG